MWSAPFVPIEIGAGSPTCERCDEQSERDAKEGDNVPQASPCYAQISSFLPLSFVSAPFNVTWEKRPMEDERIGPMRSSRINSRHV